ncbi:hypothetical protein BDW68DRAFT_157795 [Aspergillus falconensis]
MSLVSSDHAHFFPLLILVSDLIGRAVVSSMVRLFSAIQGAPRIAAKEYTAGSRLQQPHGNRTASGQGSSLRLLASGKEKGASIERKTSS